MSFVPSVSCRKHRCGVLANDYRVVVSILHATKEVKRGIDFVVEGGKFNVSLSVVFEALLYFTGRIFMQINQSHIESVW